MSVAPASSHRDVTDERLTFLDGPLPARFRLSAITVAPGDSRPYRAEEWDDALVVVERGAVELECRAGGRRRFGEGAVMWLQGMDLRTIRSVGETPLVLAAVSRRLPGGPTCVRR